MRSAASGTDSTGGEFRQPIVCGRRFLGSDDDEPGLVSRGCRADP